MESYSEKREINRIGLETFFLNLENNHYDYNVDKLISSLVEKLDNLKIKKQNEKLDQTKEMINEIEIMFLYKELFAISEMKIIYAYKHLELHLKFLLKASYQKSKENEFYRWESIVIFLKARNIKIDEVENYAEVNELRVLNNSIKHSRSILNEKTKNILEFKDKDRIQYSDILSFYKRIEECSINFIKSLSYLIQKDLYEFDDNRIEEIAGKILMRMDKNTVEKLVAKLK
jgi:hypothetical protein